jgi:acetyl esterase/lipase
MVAMVLGLSACRLTDVTLWRSAPPPAGEACEVEVIRDVGYYGPGADDPRHRLDLYLPKGEKDFPVVVLVHGGAWLFGDNRCCGLYPAVGEFFARHGVGAVLPNYRLSPGVRHPEHVKDVARAFAWAHAHVAEYGGRPDRLFLAGHSAGGHLVSLLATDESYLQAEGLRTADVRGVISLSGVYVVPTGRFGVTVGGEAPLAFRLDELTPLRGTDDGGGKAATGVGMPVSLNVFGPVFGDDPRVRAEASPLNHVRPGLPPFLLFSAEKDLPTLPTIAEEFANALRDQGNEAWLLRVRGRNHNSIMFRAIVPEDPVARAMLEFIRQHAADGGN